MRCKCYSTRCQYLIPCLSYQKYEHIDSQVDAYAAKLRVPRSVVADLFTQELLSDEASGPEDEADETFEAWKVRMAAAAGHKNLTAVALKKEHFVEVLECPWRSDEVSFTCAPPQCSLN
jgi:hypothetical protein